MFLSIIYEKVFMNLYDFYVSNNNHFLNLKNVAILYYAKIRILLLVYFVRISDLVNSLKVHFQSKLTNKLIVFIALI